MPEETINANKPKKNKTKAKVTKKTKNVEIAKNAKTSKKRR